VSFRGELILRYLDEPVDGKWFETVGELAYINRLNVRYTVPVGTHTDFASIPRGFRWMISRVGRYGRAAVIHDHLCESKVVTRKVADRVFLEAMKELGVGWWKRRVMFMGVRAYSIGTFQK